MFLIETALYSTHLLTTKFWSQLSLLGNVVTSVAVYCFQQWHVQHHVVPVTSKCFASMWMHKVTLIQCNILLSSGLHFEDYSLELYQCRALYFLFWVASRHIVFLTLTICSVLCESEYGLFGIFSKVAFCTVVYFSCTFVICCMLFESFIWSQNNLCIDIASFITWSIWKMAIVFSVYYVWNIFMCLYCRHSSCLSFIYLTKLLVFRMLGFAFCFNPA